MPQSTNSIHVVPRGPRMPILPMTGPDCMSPSAASERSAGDRRSWIFRIVAASSMRHWLTTFTPESSYNTTDADEASFVSGIVTTSAGSWHPVARMASDAVVNVHRTREFMGIMGVVLAVP